MKKKYKFNVVDVIIGLIILVVLSFVAFKFSNGIFEKSTEISSFEFRFHAYEVPSFVTDYIEEGAKVSDDGTGSYFGNVIEFSVGESKVYNVNYNGNVVNITRTGYDSIDLVVNGSAELTDNGIRVGLDIYNVGSVIVLKVGNAEFDAIISGIRKLD